MAIAEIVNYQSISDRTSSEIALDGSDAVGVDVELGLSDLEFFYHVDNPEGTNRKITNSTMNGNGRAPYFNVTQDRLLIGEPTGEDIERIGPQYITALDPEAIPTINFLKAAEIRVFAHSGGFARVLEILQKHLQIPIYWNQIHLNEQTKKYTVLEDQSVLLLDDGKRILMEQLVEQGAVPLNFSTGGDSPKEMAMGGSPSFAVTTFEYHPETVAKSDFSMFGLFGGLPIWLGEKRWKLVRDQAMAAQLRIGMERILKDQVSFQNQELGKELKERILFHLDTGRDFDVRHILPKNGVIFNGNGKSY